MNGYRVSGPWDQRHHEHNARVADAHVNSEHYVRDLHSRAGLEAATTTGSSHTALVSVSAVRFPTTSATPTAGWQMLRPDHWLDGIVKIERVVHSYSSSGNACVLTFTAAALADGDALSASADLSQQVTVPAGAAANTVYDYTDDDLWFPVDQSHIIMFGNIIRNVGVGSDGLAVFRLQSIRLRYVPRRQEI